MKNNSKKKNEIVKNSSSLNKEFHGPNNIQNNFNLNNINIEEDVNHQKMLEKKVVEEINKIEIANSKKEKLKDINLLEKNANDLYNWNTLLKRKYPLEKKKKKYNTFKKINYNLIDYDKGINVLCKISNEFLINFYKDIAKNKISTKELSPKFKLRNKNFISDLINSKRLTYQHKEQILKYLILNEKENPKFKNEDLIITNKRKNPDILIKTSFTNNQIIESNKNNSKSNENIKKNKGSEKKLGLILSYYDESNPDIIKFIEEIHSLSGQNKKNITLFEDLKKKDNIYNIKYRNILSSKNRKIADNTRNNLIIDKEDIQNFSYGSTDLSMSSNKIDNLKKELNFFKDKRRKKSNNISLKLYSYKTYRSTNNLFYRPKSSSTLIETNQNKLYFLNNKSNKKCLSYENFKEIEFMHGFPEKKSSNVGNNIYDKINRILKHRLIKKYKLNPKKYYKNLLTITINRKYKKEKEESKNNKKIQTFLPENLKPSLTKTSEADIILNKNINHNDNEKFSSKADEKNQLNKKVNNNFYSCCNNYQLNIRRKNKNKSLNDLFHNDYLNQIIFVDRFTQTNLNKRNRNCLCPINN